MAGTAKHGALASPCCCNLLPEIPSGRSRGSASCSRSEPGASCVQRVPPLRAAAKRRQRGVWGETGGSLREARGSSRLEIPRVFAVVAEGVLKLQAPS